MRQEVEMTTEPGPAARGILVSDKTKDGENQVKTRSPLNCVQKLLYQNLGLQMRIRLWYDSIPVQYFFTLMILLNFILILIAATPYGLDNPDVKQTLAEYDKVFVYIFLIELIINMYGNWFWHFWEVTKWNHFDFIVIALSLASPVMSAVRVARVVRLLRVLRVAGKLESLRTIVATFDRSMGAVGAVVALLLMLMCIYAVFGVNDYKDKDPENFGDLGKALFTMFQLVTIEGWPDIARSLMKVSDSAPIFFVSFMIIAALTTIEVVAAIFLDKMAEAKDYVKEEQELALREEEAREDIVKEHIAVIGKYNTGEITESELQNQIEELAKRDEALKGGRLDKAQVEEKVNKDRSMQLSMDLGSALKESQGAFSMFDADGDGKIDEQEMDVGVVKMLTKLSTQMEALADRMGRIETAVKKGKRNLISG